MRHGRMGSGAVVRQARALVESRQSIDHVRGRMRPHSHEATVRSDRENMSGTSHGGNCGPTCVAREHHVLIQKQATLNNRKCFSKVCILYTTLNFIERASGESGIPVL